MLLKRIVKFIFFPEFSNDKFCFDAQVNFFGGKLLPASKTSQTSRQSRITIFYPNWLLGKIS
jgi:hypothetical protein